MLQLCHIFKEMLTYVLIRVIIFEERRVLPMPMKPREMIKLLQDNGFVEVSQNGSHKKMIKPGVDIPPIIVPMHSKELKKGTEQAILKQAGLKK